MMNLKKSIEEAFIAFAYFLTSTVITWLFILKASLLYSNKKAMVLSCSIAGAKWGIQIIAALLLLKDKRWVFLGQIARVCFIGSCILLPYSIFTGIRLLPFSFLVSLIAAILAMIFFYYRAVKHIKVSSYWFWCWIGCLAVAVMLQVLVVFKLF